MITRRGRLSLVEGGLCSLNVICRSAAATYLEITVSTMCAALTHRRSLTVVAPIMSLCTVPKLPAHILLCRSPYAMPTTYSPTGTAPSVH